jgi:sulfur-oxidizing protein SoxA
MRHARLIAMAICGALSLGWGQGAFAQSAEDIKKGIDQYREMLQDGNPADLTVAKGEGLWKKKQGPHDASLEQCDLGKGPGVVAGAYAELPRYFADTGRVMDAESRIVHCIAVLQGRDATALAAKPFSGGGQPQTELESLVAYIVDESRGVPVNLPQQHPEEIASYQRGEKAFFYRAGPYDFACASCHSVDDQRIRLQELPNLTEAESAQRAFTTWPAYRVSQGAMRTMQWRMYDCFRQQRFPEMIYGSQVSIDLITFLGVKAKGAPMDSPAIKR